MPNSENSYEDSYQKGERLRQELEMALSEVRILLETAKSGVESVSDLTNKVDDIEKKIEEYKELEKRLKIELDEMNTKSETISDLDEQIDAKVAIAEQQSKIWELWVKQDDLYNELLKIYEDEPGMKGDVEGTVAVIKLKLQRIEDIKKELEEIEN